MRIAVSSMLLLASCHRADDPAPAAHPSVATHTSAPSTPESPPAGGEIPCNGIDDDGDGRPAPDAACAPARDSTVFPLDAEHWPFVRIVPDFDGDGLDDVLTISGNGPREAQLVSGVTGHGITTIKEWGPKDLAEPATVGEFDGEPGLDIWVSEELFYDPVGTDHDADASRPDDEAILAGVADFDGDGIDDLVAFGGGFGRTLPDWRIGTGPFAGSDGDGFTSFAPGAEDVLPAGDLDGDGLPDLLVTWPDGEADLAHADGSVFASTDPPMVPRPGGDFDGDGTADLIIGWTAFEEDERDCDQWQLAGPFSGTVPFDAAVWLTNSTICEGLQTMPDFDQDGRTDYAELGGTLLAYTADRMPAAPGEGIGLPVFSAPMATESGFGGVTWGDLDGVTGLDALVDSYQAGGAIYLNVGF